MEIWKIAETGKGSRSFFTFLEKAQVIHHAMRPSHRLVGRLLLRSFDALPGSAPPFVPRASAKRSCGRRCKTAGAVAGMLRDDFGSFTVFFFDIRLHSHFTPASLGLLSARRVSLVKYYLKLLPSSYGGIEDA